MFDEYLGRTYFRCRVEAHPGRRKTSPGNVLLRGCKGASSLTIPKMSASRASPSSKDRVAVSASCGGRPFALKMTELPCGLTQAVPVGLSGL